MRKWILLLLLALPAASETFHEASTRLYDRGTTLVLPSSWGGQMASEDLKLLLGTLRAASSWGEDVPLSRAVLDDVRLSMHRYRERLRVSLAALPDPAATLAWLNEVAQVEARLDQVDKSFGGHSLPDAVELAQSDMNRDWNPPGYDDPKELLRQARSLRIDVLSLSNPFILPGNGFGSYGLSYGGGWSGEFEALQQATYNFESVCNSRYEDVRQTRRAYQKVHDAFEQVFPQARINSHGFRNVERAIRQLDKFYAAL